MYFSTVFIPRDSIAVKTAASEAYRSSQKPDFISSHLHTTAFAVKAVALSFFSTFSYLVRSAGHIATHIAELDVKALAKDFEADSLYALQSMLLSAFGVFYIASALVFPKTVFQYFPEVPPAPPRNFAAEVQTLSLQNQQLAYSLYLEGQARSQSANALALERNQRQLERAQSLGTISYLDAESKRVVAEKQHEIYQRGHLEYQFSQLAVANSALGQQLQQAKADLAATTLQKTQSEAALAQALHEKSLVEAQVAVIMHSLEQRTREKDAAELQVVHVTALAQTIDQERIHLANVLDYLTHQKNVMEYHLALAMQEIANRQELIAHIQNILAARTQERDISATQTALAMQEVVSRDQMLAHASNVLATTVHERDVAGTQTALAMQEIINRNALLEHQANVLSTRSHENNILVVDNSQLRTGNAQIANLQANLHAAEARVLQLTQDLADETRRKTDAERDSANHLRNFNQANQAKAAAEADVVRLTREKALVEAEVVRLTHENGQLSAGNAQVANLQADLLAAQTRAHDLDQELTRVKADLAQAQRNLGELPKEIAEQKRLQEAAQAQILALGKEKAALEEQIALAHLPTADLTRKLAAAETDLQDLQARALLITGQKEQAERDTGLVRAELVTTKQKAERLEGELAAAKRVSEEQLRKIAELTRQKGDLDQAAILQTRQIEQISSERDRLAGEVARLSTLVPKVPDEAIDAKDVEIASLQREIGTLRDGAAKKQQALLGMNFKDITTPEVLATVVEALQATNASRQPIDMTIAPILEELDRSLGGMLLRQKENLEASFTRATAEGGPVHVDKVSFKIGETKFTDGAALFAHLQTHSPDKDSKKSFPTEILGLVHFRQKLFDDFVFPALKTKFTTPSLGLSLVNAEVPMQFSLTIHEEKNKPVQVVMQKTFYLTKTGTPGSKPEATVVGSLVLDLHKPKHSGLSLKRNANPEEKAFYRFTVEKIT